LSSKILFEGDLDGLHVAVVHEGLQEDVSESKHDQVLHDLLAQVVVDAVDVVLVPQGRELGGHFQRRLQVVPKGLLHDDSVPPILRPGRGINGPRGRNEHVGGDGEVEQAIHPVARARHCFLGQQK
jgi:hypothetical protein